MQHGVRGFHDSGEPSWKHERDLWSFSFSCVYMVIVDTWIYCLHECNLNIIFFQFRCRRR